MDMAAYPEERLILIEQASKGMASEMPCGAEVCERVFRGSVGEDNEGMQR
jgi:hypothetical protein